MATLLPWKNCVDVQQCISCKELFIRTCKKCQNEYCREDNDASSDTMVRIPGEAELLEYLRFLSATGVTSPPEGPVRCIRSYVATDLSACCSLACCRSKHGVRCASVMTLLLVLILDTPLTFMNNVYKALQATCTKCNWGMKCPLRCWKCWK
jgi:hypothetical protein